MAGTGSPEPVLTAAGATPRRPPLPPSPYLVVGLGRAGHAAALALAARAGPAAVRVWDAAADSPQQARTRELRALGVEVGLGGDGVDALAGVRTVVKSPGVPPEIPPLATALGGGLTVLDELEIGWRLVPAPTVAVTGTNGKSTVAALSMAVLAASGLEPALAGNTEFGPPLSELSLGAAPRSVVAEVSSYQAEFSAPAVDAAVFTNLTVDHLNRHPTMAAYGRAKRRLFVRGSWAVPLAALNADDRLGREIAAAVESRSGRALRCGWGENADYRVLKCAFGLRDASLTLSTPSGRTQVETRLPGAHNAANATSALALADGLGLPRETTLAALAAAPPVPGRFEVVETACPFDVVVDLGYTVDSVTKVLATARALVAPRRGRLIAVLAVVGRVGPMIGADVAAAARRHSDHLILSGTSYYGEPRLVTLARMAAGARAASGGSCEIVIDRRAAIARAIELARSGDLVAILGRGPTRREATDARGGFRLLDDRQVAWEAAERCAS